MTACKIGSAATPLAARKVLEVIVTSVEEAFEAERGGADRLEVVRCLEKGGLTPPLDLVAKIASVVRLPTRVMLRESPSMSISSDAELNQLTAAAENLAQLPIDGLVLGFLRAGEVDSQALRQILAAAPHLSATFHRAFEHLQSPLSGLRTLKTFAQIDRILIRVRPDGAGIDLELARAWQRLAEPQIRFILGIGLSRTLAASIREEPSLSEIHVGRGAREPETPLGLVQRSKVAHLKSALL